MHIWKNKSLFIWIHSELIRTKAVEKKNLLSQKAAEKEREKMEEQMGQLENKKQDGRFKSDHINNNIKRKFSKHYK